MFTQYVDAQLNLQHPPGWETRFFRGLGWCPARRHTDMCIKALQWGADVICITGADQMHPEDMLCRLLARMQEGYEIIAAMVPSRGYVGWQEMQPFERMAWRLKRCSPQDLDAANALQGLPNDVEVIDPTAGDVQEINFIGSGVIMFQADHLLALKRPWFYETFTPDTYERQACMDTMFSWRMQTEAGAHLYVDTTIQVRHLHIFPIDETYSQRFADWTDPTTPGIDHSIAVYPQEG